MEMTRHATDAAIAVRGLNYRRRINFEPDPPTMATAGVCCHDLSPKTQTATLLFEGTA